MTLVRGRARFHISLSRITVSVGSHWSIWSPPRVRRPAPPGRLRRSGSVSTRTVRALPGVRVIYEYCTTLALNSKVEEVEIFEEIGRIGGLELANGLELADRAW